MQSMFNSCSNLKVLDISGFDCSKITTGANMFYNLQNIKYTVLKGMTLPSSESIKSQVITDLNSANNLIVCQNGNILTNNDIVYACCDFDTNTNLCK